MSKVEKENLVVKHNTLINATSKYKYEWKFWLKFDPLFWLKITHM